MSSTERDEQPEAPAEGASGAGDEQAEASAESARGASDERSEAPADAKAPAQLEASAEVQAKAKAASSPEVAAALAALAASTSARAQPSGRSRRTVMLVFVLVMLGALAFVLYRMSQTARSLTRRKTGGVTPHTSATGATPAAALAAHRRKLAAQARARRAARVSRLRPRRLAALPIAGLRYLTRMALGPRGRLVAVGGGGGRVVLIDLGTDREVRRFPAHSGAVRALAFGRDGGRDVVVSAGRDGRVRVWSTSGDKVRDLRRRGAAVRDLAVAGGRVAVAAEGDGLEIIALAGATKGKPRAALRVTASQAAGGWVRAVALTRDGKRVAVAGEDGKLRIFDAASAALQTTLDGHPQWVNALAFSPDGSKLASAGFEKRVSVWDVASGERLVRFRGHVRRCVALAWSRDGQRLASASLDRRVVVWDVPRKKRAALLVGHRYQVSSVAFDPRGRFVVSASGDGTVRLWPTGLRRPPSMARLGRVGPGEVTLRGYTSGERRRVRLVDKRGRVLASGRRALAEVLRSGPDDAVKLPDPRLVKLIYKVVAHFGRWREVIVISGYRSSRFNKLRTRQSKQVARKSQHILGRAIDFKLSGVSLRRLHKYVKKLRAGGLGLYPDSQFIHMDVGKVRYWGGN